MKNVLLSGLGLAWPKSWLISLVALWLVTPSLWAPNFTVQMTGGLVFSPNVLSIGEGDSVTWTNVGNVHTSTSGNAPPASNGLWDSGTVNLNGSYTVTFTNFAGGTYPYFCSFHFSLGMTGTLTITNATVTQPALSKPLRRTNQFQFTLQGMIGQSYIIESSSNLANWFVVSTNLATASRLTVSEPGASSRFGLFRARLAP